jgi:hypothetical protein
MMLLFGKQFSGCLLFLSFYDICVFVFYFRCRKWVINCCRADLDGKSAEELNKLYYLCADHFEDTQFTNISHNRLNWNAVPTLFNVSACGYFQMNVTVHVRIFSDILDI